MGIAKLQISICEPAFLTHEPLSIEKERVEPWPEADARAAQAVLVLAPAPAVVSIPTASQAILNDPDDVLRGGAYVDLQAQMICAPDPFSCFTFAARIGAVETHGATACAWLQARVARIVLMPASVAPQCGVGKVDVVHTCC